MSNAARKARKRAGIKFERTPKVGTPIMERFIPMVTSKGRPVPHLSGRALRKRDARLAVIEA